VKTFFVAFYFDLGLEDFVIHAICSKREDADAALAELPADTFKPRVVVEESLDSIKKRLLDNAIADAKRIHGLMAAQLGGDDVAERIETAPWLSGDNEGAL
jgi:hypothetical protein